MSTFILALALAAQLPAAPPPPSEPFQVTVEGRVTRGSGAGIPDVTVELSGPGVDLSATTDASGAFVFPDVLVRPGTYTLTFKRGDAVIRQRTVEIAAGQAGARIDASVSLAMAAPIIKPPPPPPPPPPPEPPPPIDLPPALPDEKHAIIPVFYATDRERESFEPLTYGARRNPDERLHLGRFDVSIPRDVHQVGHTERPNIWTFYREDPDRHLVIVRRQEKTYAAFYEEVSAVVGRSERREAFVFVHGFNVGFEDAVYRTAQIAYDLNFDGAPILYSWPSVGTLATYPADVNNSTWTAEHLRWFLEDVAAKSGAQAVHLVAHSMGNAPLLRALNDIATRSRTSPRPRFRQILLTAPDVDVAVFRQLAAAITSVSDRVTLYASSNDVALRLSKSIQGGYPRAGDTVPSIVTMPGLDSIDVSDVDTNLIGHFYYAANRSVLSDIMRLIRTGRPPGERCGVNPIVDGAARYWKFIAAAICPN